MHRRCFLLGLSAALNSVFRRQPSLCQKASLPGPGVVGFFSPNFLIINDLPTLCLTCPERSRGSVFMVKKTALARRSVWRVNLCNLWQKSSLGQNQYPPGPERPVYRLLPPANSGTPSGQMLNIIACRSSEASVVNDNDQNTRL